MRFILWKYNSGYDDKLEFRWPVKTGESSRNNPSQKL